MASVDIYRKTPRGVAEVTDRKLKLNARVRTMLILIDGLQPEFVILEEGGKVGAPVDFLEQLLNLGLVERSGRATASAASAAATPVAVDEYSRFRAAKDFMNVTVVDALGIKSFFFTLKLERAGNVEDLRALAGAWREAIAKSMEEAQVAVLAARLAEMLR